MGEKSWMVDVVDCGVLGKGIGVMVEPDISDELELCVIGECLLDEGASTMSFSHPNTNNLGILTFLRLVIACTSGSSIGDGFGCKSCLLKGPPFEVLLVSSAFHIPFMTLLAGRLGLIALQSLGLARNTPYRTLSDTERSSSTWEHVMCMFIHCLIFLR